MAIKAIINNTEKEIEQIKNSDEQDIDYVYSRIGDTEVEGEPPISIKSIGRELANYRIYGNTVSGESVGDLIESGEHAGEYKVDVTVEGKNLLQNIATSQTIRGVTFTVNSDGSIVCDGQASPSTATLIYSNFLVPSGTYIFTGCPNGGSERETYKMLLFINGAWFANDMGSGANFTLTKTSTVSARIDIYNGYTCNNLTFYPMIRKADIEDDTYEPYHAPVTTPIYLPEPIKMVGDEAEYVSYDDQKLHRVGADDIDVTLPTLSTIKGTNTFSVNTSIQPPLMYIKDNFDYKKVFTATRTIEGESPLNYRSIEDSDSTLSNYRIYGNTVNGESVGEKTANLFDGEIEQGSVRINDGTETDSDYRIRTKKISVKPITTYTISSHLYIRAICLYNDGVFISTEVDRPMNANHQITLTMPNNANQIQISFKNSATDTPNNSALITPDDFEWGMLNYGSEPLPYEPYGYRVPVTVSNGTDTEITNLYLPEQIKMVGNEAEYVDYKEQKQHFADGTSVDVNLPALPTLVGTNVLSVGTEVQPSGVEIKGHIK